MPIYFEPDIFEREEDMSFERFPAFRALKGYRLWIIGERDRRKRRKHYFVDRPGEREARIQGHIKRIRSDPRWKGNDTLSLDPAEIVEIREKYQAHWDSISKKRRRAMQCELAKIYRVKAQAIYEVLGGRRYKNVR